MFLGIAAVSGGMEDALLPGAAAIVVLVLSVMVLVLLWRRGAAAENVMTVALYAPYLAAAILALWCFRDSPDIGWVLLAIACVLMAAESIYIAIVEFCSEPMLTAQVGF